MNKPKRAQGNSNAVKSMEPDEEDPEIPTREKGKNDKNLSQKG